MASYLTSVATTADYASTLADALKSEVEGARSGEVSIGVRMDVIESTASTLDSAHTATSAEVVAARDGASSVHDRLVAIEDKVATVEGVVGVAAASTFSMAVVVCDGTRLSSATAPSVSISSLYAAATSEGDPLSGVSFARLVASCAVDAGEVELCQTRFVSWTVPAAPDGSGRDMVRMDCVARAAFCDVSGALTENPDGLIIEYSWIRITNGGATTVNFGTFEGGMSSDMCISLGEKTCIAGDVLVLGVRPRRGMLGLSSTGYVRIAVDDAATAILPGVDTSPDVVIYAA